MRPFCNSTVSGMYAGVLAIKPNGSLVNIYESSPSVSSPSWASGLTDIVQVYAGFDFSWALRANGTFVTDGRIDLSKLTDIVTASGWYYNSSNFVAIRSDGSLVDKNGVIIDSDKFIALNESKEGSDWIRIKSDNTCTLSAYSSYNDIVCASYGAGFSIILRANGTCVTSRNDFNETVSGWNNIVAISANDKAVFGVKSDGSLVYAGYTVFNSGGATTIPAEFSNLVDVFGIKTQGVVALKADGTLVGGANYPNVFNGNYSGVKIPTPYNIPLRFNGGVMNGGM